jgi:hypothetical protein
MQSVARRSEDQCHADRREASHCIGIANAVRCLVSLGSRGLQCYAVSNLKGGTAYVVSFSAAGVAGIFSPDQTVYAGRPGPGW